MLFNDFTAQFLDISRDDGNSAGELVQKELALRNHLGPFFIGVELEEIGAPEILAYKKFKLTEDYAPKTINNHLMCLSRLLAVAREHRVLKTPYFAIKYLPVNKPEARYLSQREIPTFLAAAKQDVDPIWHRMLSLCLNTGMRIGEMLALDWKAVDVTRRTLTVRASFCRVAKKIKGTKTGQAREIALNQAAMVALLAMPDREGLVFDVSYEQCFAAINRVATRCGLADIGWHSLRHTFASHLVTEGVPLFTVSKLLGHKSMHMTERYAHLNADKNKDAVAILANVMGI